MTRIQIINYSLWSTAQVSRCIVHRVKTIEDLSRLLWKKNEEVVNDNGQRVIASYVKRKVVNSSVETLIMHGLARVVWKKIPEDHQYPQGNHCLAVGHPTF